MQPRRMSLRRLFRGLILSQAAVVILQSVLPTPAEGDPTITMNVSPSGISVDRPWLAILALIFVVGLVISLIGLYRFRSWARPTYAVLMLGAVAARLMVPPELTTTRADAVLTVAFWAVSATLIGLAYFSPLATNFRHRVAAA